MRGIVKMVEGKAKTKYVGQAELRMDVGGGSYEPVGANIVMRKGESDNGGTYYLASLRIADRKRFLDFVNNPKQREYNGKKYDVSPMGLVSRKTTNITES